MPPIPRWYADLPKIRRRVEDMDDSVPLDRKAIEGLFGLKPRQSNYLMRKFKGYAVGQSTALTRSDLLERIDELAAPGGVAAAKIQEKKRAVSFFAAEERKVRPERIPPPPPKPTAAALPSGMRLIAPGRLLIEFHSPEELLSHNLALSQSAITDFASFAAGLEFVSPRNGDCTVDHLLPLP
jgi:hypothetical protein